MLSRRMFCLCGAGALAAGVTGAHASDQECVVFQPERQQALSPFEALARLRGGNARFVSGATINCDLMQQVQASAGGQSPFAAIVACIDSRVAPEMVFDQRIGDVFCARVAGNIVNDDILGSLEFATEVAGARAIVVLGHSGCGAIRGAIDGVEMGHLTGLLRQLRPAIERVMQPAGTANAELVQKVADENVRLSVAGIVERSPVLARRVASGKLAIAGAMQDLQTGRVDWL